jgi:hypothetical protein
MAKAESAAVLPLPNGAIIKEATRADATEAAIVQAAAVMCETTGVDCLEEDLRDFLKSPDAQRLRSELEGVLLHVLLKRKARHLTKLKELAA